MRVVIAGVPRSGKTTLAGTMSSKARSTDTLIDLGWSDASAKAATWFDEPGPWVLEGVAMGRALRKWLEAHPRGQPCDEVIVLDTPKMTLTKGQAVMAAGCKTVMKGLIPALQARGVKVTRK